MSIPVWQRRQTRTRSVRKRAPLRVVACELALLTLALFAAQAQHAQPDLTTLEIEDLMNVDVTSASKTEQKLSNVPAAMSVITPEEIRRSGATNIPDLLRMVPGLEVAQIDASRWAISARGFNGQYANKLLVLIDGRAVYTPIFSGVYWDAQDVKLDSIERIEVIRGPGATVWGTNAVNGVISIITKSARDTQSGNATVAAGTLEHPAGAIRYGGKIGGRGAYRVFADGLNIGHLVTPDLQNANDDWYRFHGGFRADEDFSAKDKLTVEGEAIRGNAGERIYSLVSLQPPVNAAIDLRERFSGWSVLTRWRHLSSPRADTSLQVYFDRSTRSDSTSGAGLNTFDIDFQQHLKWGRRQDLVWGLGYRLNSDENASTLRVSFVPPDLNTQIFSSFAQDEITIRPGRFYLTLGTKVEHDYYNQFNLQPTLRMLWTADDRNTFWAAISGAQRTPSRADTGIRYNYAAFAGPGNLPGLVSLFGSWPKKNEQLLATEAGYRTRSLNRLSLSSSVFFNQYHDLTSVEPGSPLLETNPQPVHLVVPTYLESLLHGEVHGMETSVNIKLARQWTVSPEYTFLTMHLHRDAASLDMTTGPSTQGGSPNQQARLRLQGTLPRHWQWTSSAYFVGRLVYPQIPSYTRLDTNLVWQASEKISVGLVGQNLLRGLHQEYSGADLTVLPSMIRRSAYARVTWQF